MSISKLLVATFWWKTWKILYKCHWILCETKFSCKWQIFEPCGSRSCWCNYLLVRWSLFNVICILYMLLLVGNSTKLLFTSCHPCLGAISALGPPGKPPQLDDSYSPYNLMSTSESPTSPLVPPDSWGQGKSPSEKISNGTNINWPPGTNIMTTLKYCSLN